MTADSHAGFKVIKVVVRNTAVAQVSFLSGPSPGIEANRGEQRRKGEIERVWGTMPIYYISCVVLVQLAPSLDMPQGARKESPEQTACWGETIRVQFKRILQPTIDEFGVFYGSHCRLITRAAPVVGVIGVQTQVYCCR